MELEFGHNGILVKNKNDNLDVLTLTDNFCVMIEKNPRSHKSKVQIVNAVITSLWINKTVRQKHFIL